MCVRTLRFLSGVLDEDVVVIEATPAPSLPANEEINVTSTDSEVEIVTVGDAYRSVPRRLEGSNVQSVMSTSFRAAVKEIRLPFDCSSEEITALIEPL